MSWWISRLLLPIPASLVPSENDLDAGWSACRKDELKVCQSLLQSPKHRCKCWPGVAIWNFTVWGRRRSLALPGGLPRSANWAALWPERVSDCGTCALGPLFPKTLKNCAPGRWLLGMQVLASFHREILKVTRRNSRKARVSSFHRRGTFNAGKQ